VPVGATGHRTQRPAAQPGAKLDPPDHIQPIPAPPLRPRGQTVANIAASGPLIAQLASGLLASFASRPPCSSLSLAPTPQTPTPEALHAVSCLLLPHCYLPAAAAGGPGPLWA
jgi:hypothetical protein